MLFLLFHYSNENCAPCSDKNSYTKVGKACQTLENKKQRDLKALRQDPTGFFPRGESDSFGLVSRLVDLTLVPYHYLTHLSLVSLLSCRRCLFCHCSCNYSFSAPFRRSESCMRMGGIRSLFFFLIFLGWREVSLTVRFVRFASLTNSSN